jgi:hypothetical protein
LSTEAWKAEKEKKQILDPMSAQSAGGLCINDKLQTGFFDFETPKLETSTKDPKTSLLERSMHSEISRDKLEHYGFSSKTGSVHSSRTILFEDLVTLFDCVPKPDASRLEYLEAIEQKNCLRKRSAKTRLLSFRHLCQLYTLDPRFLLFRALRYFWSRDPASQAPLALLCSYSRDPILRLSAEFILRQPLGALITPTAMEGFIETNMPGRFSEASLHSLAQNLLSSWAKAGLLEGKIKKTRVQCLSSIGAVCYALFIGHLQGLRGQELFSSDYVRILDCTPYEAVEIAKGASLRGWLSLKILGNIAEIRFPLLENPQ